MARHSNQCTTPRAVIGQICSTRLPRTQTYQDVEVDGLGSQWPGIRQILSPSPSGLVAAETASGPAMLMLFQ